MTQVYNSVAATQLLQNSLAPLLARDDAAASNFAGSTFPTSGLLTGMSVYRTDTQSLYLLTDPVAPVWSQVLLKLQADLLYLSTLGGTIPAGGTLTIAGALAFGQDTQTISGLFGRYSPAYAGAAHKYLDTSGGNNDPTFIAWQFGATGIERMRLTNVGGLTLATPAGVATVWNSLNDGAGSGLDADTIAGKNLAYITNYANLTGAPVLSDAAGTSVAVIRGGVAVGDRISRYGDTGLSGSFLTSGTFGVVGPSYPHMFIYSTTTGIGYAMRVEESSSAFQICQSDSAGNVSNNMFHVSLGGGIQTPQYGWLDQTFAAAYAYAGQGATRVTTAANQSGNIPNNTGLEIYGALSSSAGVRQQVRAWVENCSNCNCTSNCNCGTNCTGGTDANGNGA